MINFKASRKSKSLNKIFRQSWTRQLWTFSLFTFTQCDHLFDDRKLFKCQTETDLLKGPGTRDKGVKDLATTPELWL